MRPWRTAVTMPLPNGAVRIDATGCVRSRLDRSQCRACADACPEDAITLEPFPALVAANCTSCRRCEAACPVGAIEGDARDLIALAGELRKVPHPVLGCSAPQVDAHVRTGCLGFLEREALLALALELPGGVTLNLTRCADCANGAAVAGITDLAEALRALPGNIGAGRLRIATMPATLGFREHPVSRREFFVRAARSCAAAATSGAPPKTGPHIAPEGQRKRLPARRRLLLRNLQPLPAPMRKPVEDALFPVLEFGSACNNCMACAGMCPTGAIATRRADPPRPEFVARRCTHCGVCEEFCAVRAITLTPAPAASPGSKPATLLSKVVS